ncbi:MAG: hypothetical protein HKO53_04590, partial [Gemmatimonadetes bacterium]|nr:hypothetical protein [Gemmatimonadota bacterium]
MVLVAPVGAQEDPPARDGTGDSYWGPIEPPAPETTAEFETAGLSAWEWPLYAIYRTVGVPFQLFTYLVRGGVIALDESGALEWISNLFGAVDLPYGFRAIVDVNSTVGGGGGLTFFHEELFGGRARFQTKAKFVSGGRTTLSGGFLVPKGEGGFDLGGGYEIRGNERFFGRGPNAEEADESYFTREITWVGGTYEQPLGADFALRGLGLF